MLYFIKSGRKGKKELKYQIRSYSKNGSAQMIFNETCEHIEQYEVVLVLTPVSWF